MEEGGEAGQRRGLAIGALIGGAAALATAVLHAVAFPPVGAAEAAYIFAVPLLAVWLFAKDSRYLGWLSLGGGVLSWLYLLAWLRHFSGHLEMPMAWVPGWLAWLSLGSVVGLFMGGWLWISGWAMRRSLRGALWRRLVLVLALPGLWVVLEWLRSWIFGGFPWLPLAASHWERPLLLQLASYTGAWGVSYCLVAFAVGLSFYLHTLWHLRREKWYRRLSWEFYLALGLLGGGLALGVGGVVGGTERPLARVGVVQPAVEPLDKWDAQRVVALSEDLNRLSQYAVALGAEWVFWPEVPMPVVLNADPQARGFVEELSAVTAVPYLVGGLATQAAAGAEPAYYNAVLSVDPQTGLAAQFYAKRRLVPFGERVPTPWLRALIGTVVPLPLDLEPGSGAQLLNFAGWEAGALICYEDVYAPLARESVMAGADFLFVATNNAWFGDGAGALQHATHSVLRAVETRRPVIRCGNAGWSGWIDAHGHVRHVVDDGEGRTHFQGAAVLNVGYAAYWNGRTTFYTRWGEWFVLLSAGLSCLGAFACLTQRK